MKSHGVRKYPFLNGPKDYERYIIFLKFSFSIETILYYYHVTFLSSYIDVIVHVLLLQSFGALLHNVLFAYILINIITKLPQIEGTNNT